MMDYKKLIDRLRCPLCLECPLERPDCKNCVETVKEDAVAAITELLERAERAEKQLAERERHGYWVSHCDENGDTKPYRTCSGCNYPVSSRVWIDGHYCPNCGAKMDEKPKKVRYNNGN